MRKWLLLPIAASLMAGACASASAKGKARDVPTLNMPAPPPRVIAPSPEPLPEPVNDLPAVAPMPPPTPSPRASRPAPRPQPPAQPPAQLRTPQDTTNASKAVQTTIDRANGMLNSVKDKYPQLSD